MEILTALKKLGDSLTPEEEAYLQANSSTSLKEFEQVSSTLGKLIKKEDPVLKKGNCDTTPTLCVLCFAPRWLSSSPIFS